MPNRDRAPLRFLKLTVAACFVVPLLLFLYVAALEWRSASRQADERLETNLNILQEHALKVLETIERSIAAVSYTHLDVYKRQGRSCPAPGGRL